MPQSILWMPKISQHSYDIAVVAVTWGHTSGVSVLKVYPPCFTVGNNDLEGKNNPFHWFLHTYNFRTKNPKTVHREFPLFVLFGIPLWNYLYWGELWWFFVWPYILLYSAKKHWRQSFFLWFHLRKCGNIYLPWSSKPVTWWQIILVLKSLHQME